MRSAVLQERTQSVYDRSVEPAVQFSGSVFESDPVKFTGASFEVDKKQFAGSGSFETDIKKQFTGSSSFEVDSSARIGSAGLWDETSCRYPERQHDRLAKLAGDKVRRRPLSKSALVWGTHTFCP